MYGSFYRTISENLLTLPIGSLALFLVVFAVIVIRALTKPAAEIGYDERLPLENDGVDR